MEYPRPSKEARMITLHANPYSPNSRKVHWALEEMGVPYTYKTVDLMKREQKTPEFLAMNPNGRVPVLDEDGFILYESNAILWYLGDKHGHGVIVPEDVRERAHIDQWMWWQASDFGPGIGRPWLMKFQARFGRPFDETRHGELIQAATSPLALLDQHLAGRQFVVADRFTIADIALTESFGLCDDAGISRADLPNLNAWHARIIERPAFRKTRPGA
jgi:glutathione S-transferase